MPFAQKPSGLYFPGTGRGPATTAHQAGGTSMAKAIPGTLKVSNDCIADLAGYAAMECYGVVGMAVTDE